MIKIYKHSQHRSSSPKLSICIICMIHLIIDVSETSQFISINGEFHQIAYLNTVNGPLHFLLVPPVTLTVTVEANI